MRTDVLRLLASLLLLTAYAPRAGAQLFGNEEERRKYTGQGGAAAPGPSLAPAPAASAAAPVPEIDPRRKASPAAAVATPVEVKPVDDEQARVARRGAEIEELGAFVKDFEAQVREYRGDVQHIIERTFDDRKAKVGDSFERQIRTLEVGERQERLDSIAVFERFIARYPEDPKYTPDAMTRLAELYYEKSVDDQQQALAEMEDRAKMGGDDTPLAEATRSFEKSIALYQKIITRFPDYRLIDAIYYLLAWCLSEEGQPEQARDTFRLLIERYPTSKYVPEAWVRIGEYYFDYSGADVDEKLLEAIKAYTAATQFRESSLFDKALYKLGWTYYRLNDFDHGVDAFIRLIDYYDEQKAKGSDVGGDLRAEALQYTAISFADEKWGGLEKNDDGTDRFLGVGKMVEFFKARGGRAYEYELFRKLGDVLFDSTRYRAAVDAYRTVLERNPWATDAPQTQERIVQCFARDQDKPSAFEEREKLVREYGEKSAWAEHNKGDQEVLNAARDLVERSLLATAQYHHAQAAEYEKIAQDETLSPEKHAEAPLRAYQSYVRAAKAYGNYLKEFPHSKNLYDITYFHAETLYNSLQFALAADEYSKVRDSNTDNKYLANAAYYVVLALQRQIEQEEQQQLLEHREPCTPKSCEAITEFKPLEIPAVRLKLIEAADTYMRKIPTAEDAPVLSYKAGQTMFTYFHFEEARKRYEEVIQRFPDKDVAEYAYEDILISYLLLKDWTNVEIFADRMINESKLVQNDATKLAEKRLLKYGARFERANIAMTNKKWDEASKLYVSIVDDTEKEAKKWGKWDNADKALYNAAMCFKEARRYDSAMRTYERLFTDYSSSPLAEQALFFVADSAERAYEYEKAIDRYMLLVERYPNAKDRVAALFNAGKLLEALQRYPEAARAYRKYAELFPNEADAPDQAYQAALIYQRMQDWKGMIEELRRFISKYDRVAGQSEKIVQAYLKMGQAQAKQQNESASIAAYKDTVKAFDTKKMTPDNYNAAQAAGEAAFWIAEQQFAEFQKMKFDPKGKGKKFADSMQSELKKLAETLEKVKKAYSEVIVKYRWPEWMMASLFRLGYSDEQFAQKLLDSPCPADVKAIAGDEGCTEYRIQLEEMMAPINDRAVLAYETAADKATELRIVNEWTKLTMEKVCQYTPTKCKSLKDARAALIFDALSADPLVADAEGKKKVEFDNALALALALADVQPRRGQAGDQLVITGNGFDQTMPLKNIVKIGEVELPVMSVTADKLVVTLPQGVQTGPISITVGASTVTAPFAFEVGAPVQTAPGIGSPATVTPGAATPAAPPVAAPAAGGGTP